MSKYGFKTEENGYCIEEVDLYIQRLQEEYRNAVEWSNELESNAKENNAGENINEDIFRLQSENESLKAENTKLISDCRLLASRLKKLLCRCNNNGLAEKDAADIIDGAHRRANEIIADAESKAAHILEKAGQKTDSILEKVEDECQSIINDATLRIEETKAEIGTLYERKDCLACEIDSLIAVRDELTQRIEQAKHLLDI